MKKSSLAALFVVVSISFPVAAAEDGRSESQSLVVGPLQTRRVNPELVSIVEQEWIRNFPKGFQVVPLWSTSHETAKACRDAACLAKTMSGNGSELAVSAEVTRLGQNYLVKVTLLDVPGARALSTVERRCLLDEDLLVATLREATYSLLGETEAPLPVTPVRAVPAKLTLDAPVTTTTVVKVPNPAKRKTLYACLGGSMVAATGVLVSLNAGYDSALLSLGGYAIGLGVVAFAVGGIAYVVTPAYLNQIQAVPVVDGRQVGVAVAGRF